MLSRPSPIRLRADLIARLRGRRPEIEQALLTRVYSVSDPTTAGDPAYVAGLRTAVSVALRYALAGIEAGDPKPGPIPVELFAQARHAARSGVSLDTVLRRYLAGHTLLSDCVVREADRLDLGAAELQKLLWSLSALFDSLLAVVGEEYTRELKELDPPGSAPQRRAERVRRLLDGEPLETAELRYEFVAWHLGAIASGPGAEQALRDLATALDRQHLLVRAGEDAVWAWLGGRSRLSAREMLSLAEQSLPAELSLALGESGQGIQGWRLTHRQARAAMSVAQRGPQRRVRYADVALLASALHDDVLASSLHDIYLAPLEGERDGGEMLRESLRAYFAVGRNVTSAAARLGIARQTVSIRLRTAEERIGHSLDTCAAETEVALQLQDLSDPHESTAR